MLHITIDGVSRMIQMPHHRLWPANATELLIWASIFVAPLFVIIVRQRCTERVHTRYPLLNHAGRGADRRTGVGMNRRLQGVWVVPPRAGQSACQRRQDHQRGLARRGEEDFADVVGERYATSDLEAAVAGSTTSSCVERLWRGGVELFSLVMTRG
jgi:hypothetical protein